MGTTEHDPFTAEQSRLFTEGHFLNTGDTETQAMWAVAPTVATTR